MTGQHEHDKGCHDGQGLRDPVCGMSVTAQSEHHTILDGVDYYFCCGRCLSRFQAAPDEFLGAGSRQPSAAASAGPGSGPYICPMCPGIESDGPASCPKCGMALEPALPALGRTQFTCPMHPEVMQDAPGNCPVCGMALEPTTVTLEEEENPELTDMTRRFWVSVVLTAPLVVIAMSELIPGIDPSWFGSARTLVWTQLLLATPVVLWGGWPFFVRGWQSIVTRNFNMFTLIGLGTGVAFSYSLIAAVTPQLFPAAFRDGRGGVAVYFEAAAVIVTLVLLGQVLELRARGRTGAALKALLSLAPTTARRVNADGTESDVALEQVRVGDRLRIRPGQKVARLSSSLG